MHPKVDIIVLVHNELEVTKGFVDHLFRNTSDFNLIFVDNGSTDKTPDFLSRGEEKGLWKVLRPGKNLGIIKGRNLGAKSVTSDYFLNIDNDQYPGKDWLDDLYEYMDRSQCDVVGCESWCLHPPSTKRTVVLSGSLVSASYYPFKRCTKPDEKFTYIGCGGMLIKKEVYDDIGLFDEQFDFAYFEDPDFSFRLIQAGYRIGWKHGCLINHLSHQTLGKQKTFDKQKQFLSSWMKFKKKWTPYFPGEKNDI